MPVSENNIREALGRYVAGDVSLGEFTEWFAPRAWELLGDGSATGQMAADIELLLAEHNAGDLTPQALREALRQYAVVRSLVHTTVELIGWANSAEGARWGKDTIDLRRSAESPRIMVSRAA
jgi:hypothetical protein